MMVVRGWEQVQVLRAARAALAPESAARFTRYITRTVYRSRYGAGGQTRRETSLPTNFMDMVARAAKPGLQNDLVTHSYALELCSRMQHARINNNHKFTDRMDALREPGSTALLCATPSMGIFSVHGRAFSFAMRCRLGLPALMGAEPDQGAEEYAGKQSAMNGRHDAATKVILQVCGLSDLITSVEPKRRYACHQGTTRPVNPDGSVLGLDGAHDTFDVSYASSLQDAKHRAVIKCYGFGSPQRRLDWAGANSNRRREARQQRIDGHISQRELDRILKLCDQNDQDSFHPGYSGPCAMAGDRFHPIILSPYGGWWRWGNNSEHNDFMANIAHSGDAAPDYDIEAPRFDHHGRTWAPWTHTAFMRQAVACATAVAAYGGATYAAKCEMRDLHSSASHHQGGDLAESIEPLEPMPEPMCAA